MAQYPRSTPRCNHTDHARCHLQAPSETVGNGPVALALDLQAHTVYVVDGLEAGLDDNLSMLSTTDKN